MVSRSIKNQHHPLLALWTTLFFIVSFPNCNQAVAKYATSYSVQVGLILDFQTDLGKVCNTSISMALEDFYKENNNYTTRVVLNARDSKKSVVGAAAAAVDLLENKVQAIIGPITSDQSKFVVNLGNTTQVPVISFSATSPSLSHSNTPYFVRTTLNDSSQVNVIAAIVHNFGWREVVPIYEDTEYGKGIIPFLVDALFLVDAKAPYRSILSPSATDDKIATELYKLKQKHTRVFVVHMSLSLGSRLFMKANELGMMREGYVWIITDGMTNLIDAMDPDVLDSMQGVIGVKPYVPNITHLPHNFNHRWKTRFRRENPSSDARLSIFALWAYDTAWAVAMAVEEVGFTNTNYTKTNSIDTTDLGKLEISVTGPKLLDAIKRTSFTGVAGRFYLVDGQLQSQAFQIVNVNGKSGREIGAWSQTSGMTRSINASTNTSNRKLGPVIWPGESKYQPKGWEIAPDGKKLVVGVPKKDGFSEFVKVEVDPVTKEMRVTGFCIDVFENVMKRLPYGVSIEYKAFMNEQGKSAGSYNDLIDQVYYKKYDAVVGDVTIIANRSRYVDFSLPFTESGVAMIVPLKNIGSTNAWIFFKPWTKDLWLATFGFFFFTGFMVWIIEHKINPDFRGPPSQQMGTIFYFIFSTLVFAQKEKVVSNLARIAVIIWVFVVFILMSSYTASLTSMLTVQNLHPVVTDINVLRDNGDFVGYPDGSFIYDMLLQLGFKRSQLKNYSTPHEYDLSLSKGSQGFGVSAILHEIPYIKIFLSNYSAKYTMVGPIYKTNGLGFVFPIGSPMVADVSRAVLNVTQDNSIMQFMEKQWLDNKTTREERSNSLTSTRLSFKNFWGLFLITGVTSGTAILLFFINFACHYKEDIKSVIKSNTSFKSKICMSVRVFDKKDSRSHTFKNNQHAEEVNDIESSAPCDNDTNSRHDSSSKGDTPCYRSDEDLNANDMDADRTNVPATSGISADITETSY